MWPEANRPDWEALLSPPQERLPVLADSLSVQILITKTNTVRLPRASFFPGRVFPAHSYFVALISVLNFFIPP